MLAKRQKSRAKRHVDYSSWFIWIVLMFIAVAILPFVVQNSEVVRSLAVMCGIPFH